MARLDANEEVMVVGDAQQTATRPKANTAYREGTFNWHLRGAPMWIVSMSTASHFDVRARLHRRQSLLYLALLIPLAVVLFRLGDRALGYTELGTVTSSEVSRDSDEKHEVVSKHTYKINTCAASSTTAHCQKSYFSFPKGYQLFMRVGHYSVNFGAGAQLAGWEDDVVFYVCAAALFAAFMFRRAAYRTLPWYRREPYELEGDGRLPRP